MATAAAVTYAGSVAPVFAAIAPSVENVTPISRVQRQRDTYEPPAAFNTMLDSAAFSRPDRGNLVGLVHGEQSSSDDDG